MAHRKFWLSIALSTGLLALMALAAGVAQLELRSGNLFEPKTLAELQLLIAQFRVYRGPLLILAAIGLVVILMIAGRPREGTSEEAGRKRQLLVVLIQIVLTVFAIFVLRRKLEESNFELTSPNLEQVPELPQVNVLPEIMPHIPDWLAFAFSLGLFLLVAVLVGGWVWQRKPQADMLQLVADDAQAALDDLQAGGDFRNVILRCYYDMETTLDQKRGIRRKQGMTAREFERSLMGLGLPQASVVELTRLFEQVRYGAKQLEQQDERRALACLSEIVRASRGDS